MNLKEAVQKLVTQHGTVRNLEENTGVDKGYISRMLTGKKVNPSDDTLSKLGLTKVVSYTLDKEKP